jgi:hypothetical protein
MISVWMLYCAGASLLVAVSGAALEHLLARRRYPTRWTWAACIVATLLLTGIAGRGEPGAAAGGTGPVNQAAAVRAEWGAEFPAMRTPDSPSTVKAALGRADSVVLQAWLLASLALAAWTAVSVLWLHVQRRTWSARTVRGVPVLVSRRVGPATVGMFRHSIVLPEWILSSQEGRLDLVLEHESEHIRAKDPRLLALALAALIVAPWNPGLWWQVRRLRLAIEIDCDARVLRGRGDVRGYGALLLEVGQRAAGGVMPVAALALSRSFLERRIRAMVRVQHRRGPAATILSAGLFATAIFGVAAMPAPAPPEFRLAAASPGAQPPRIRPASQDSAAPTRPRRAGLRPSAEAATGGQVPPRQAGAAPTQPSAGSPSDPGADLRRQVAETHAAIRRAVQHHHPGLWTSGLGRGQYIWFLVDLRGRVEATGVAATEWGPKGWSSVDIGRSMVERFPGVAVATSHHSVKLELAGASTANVAWVTRH